MDSKEFHFKKKYGQNFLKDNNILNRILEVSHILEDSLVIEIGPGAGALTKLLAKEAKQVIAYEIDDSLEEILDHELLQFENIKVIYGDFLLRNIQQDLDKYHFSHLYVIANLPYYITTPIITKLIDEDLPIDKIVVMVQKEVADRFCAKPKTKEYGSITVYLNYYFNIKKEFFVSRNSFIPVPNIDSSIISFTKKDCLLPLKNRDFFFQIVRDSFQFKRKTLRNNLKKYNLERIEEVLKQYHFDLNVRAEELPLEVFVEIGNNL